MIAFMASEGYISLNSEASVSSEEIAAIYTLWCKENGLPPVKPRKVSDFLIAHQKQYGIEHTNNHMNSAHRRVRGFKGIEPLIHPTGEDLKGFTQVWPKDNPFEGNDSIVQTYIDSGRIWEFMQRPGQAPVPQQKQMTFEEYARHWLATFKEPALKPTSIATYKKHLRAVLPVFGKMNIGSITVDDIQQYLNERKHLAKKTLSEQRHFMGGIFKAAVEDGLIDKDPTASGRIKIQSDISYERQPLPFEDFKEILDSLDHLSPSDQRFLALLMFTAMRRGEVLGLKWEDIDCEAGLIQVRRNVTHPGGNQPVIGTTKTKSGKRYIPLDAFLLEILTPPQTKGFIIGGEKPITLRMYTNTWNRIKKAVDLHGATPHVLRHSYITYMAGLGIDPKTMQHQAGHATVDVTMNIYAHAQMDKTKEAGEKMHQLLVG